MQKFMKYDCDIQKEKGDYDYLTSLMQACQTR